MIDIGVGAGVESMSLQYGPGAVTEFSELLDSHPEAKNCKVGMGNLSEAMAKDRGVTRAKQDAFAAASYAKAAHAQDNGWFDAEVVPLKVKYEDLKTDEWKEITVSKDDGIRRGVTAESLGKIKPAFAKDGSIHGGNASQISDGAAAVLLMKRSTAEKLGQKILGKYVTASVVGVAPLLMGVGPWASIPLALEKAGITKDEVDVYEINEAFASQCVWCIEALGLDEKKINPGGGAIAFGHPLGCTGARQVGTLLGGLKRGNGKIGVTTTGVKGFRSKALAGTGKFSPGSSRGGLERGSRQTDIRSPQGRSTEECAYEREIEPSLAPRYLSIGDSSGTTAIATTAATQAAWQHVRWDMDQLYNLCRQLRNLSCLRLFAAVLSLMSRAISSLALFSVIDESVNSMEAILY
ncbi:hypothetical protein V492_05837 [Pseudogymnoascus sp. VKM F-4246]|nr:hypothetical protein V492_05837 [Pseudogymnoascus sp. VKM F-4246]